MTESIFAVVTIFWKAAGNAVGGTVAVTQQLNELAKGLQDPSLEGLVPAAINYFIDGKAAGDGDKDAVKKALTLFGNATMNSINGMSNTTLAALSVQSVR